MHLVCVSVLDGGRGVCQETWAMSRTRVWMSWRHSGHVSNCKAHSIHIPLKGQTSVWGDKRGRLGVVLVLSYPCPQGRSSVSAMTSQHSVQQLSRMLTCFSKARRRCLKHKQHWWLHVSNASWKNFSSENGWMLSLFTCLLKISWSVRSADGFRLRNYSSSCTNIESQMTKLGSDTNALNGFSSQITTKRLCTSETMFGTSLRGSSFGWLN